MSLLFSAAHSSRITKRTNYTNPSLKRSSSSPFKGLKQRKPIQRSHSKPETVHTDEDDLFNDSLEDLGIVNSLTTDLSLRDVAQVIQHVRSHMFDAMPESGGFNSTRIAEILNFRRFLPPTVTVSHIHTMTVSPTKTEREIAELIKSGTVRKIVIPGRGMGGSSIGEGLILFTDIEKLIRGTKDLGQDLSSKFLAYLCDRPTAQSIPAGIFFGPDVTRLMRAGFLTASCQHLTSVDVLSRPGCTSQGTLTSISSISKAVSGSLAAVGGENAICGAGGSGSVQRSSSISQSEQYPYVSHMEGVDLKVSLPGTGSYLRLLTSARSHLLSLITKSKFREIPLYLLQERWNGGISADDPAAKAKKYRGEFSGVSPHRTRKWKQFYGLSFDWVLAECLGAGLLEVFETGSVGRAARIP